MLYNQVHTNKVEKEEQIHAKNIIGIPNSSFKCKICNLLIKFCIPFRLI